MPAGRSSVVGKETHPLAESMARLGRINPSFQMPIRDPAEGGWIGADKLFLTDDARLRDLVTAYGESYWGSTNRHVAGSAFIIAYLTRLVWPVIGQYVLDRRVPDVSLSNLAFHRTVNSLGSQIDATALTHPYFAVLPDDPSVTHPDAVVVKDEAALYIKLKQWLFDDNLAKVIEALNRAAQASIKISQNAVASACAQAFHRLYPVVENPDAMVQKASVLFNDPTSPVYGQVTMEVFKHQDKCGFFARRRGCCLAWRTERLNGYCSNCVLVSREEQDQLFRRIDDGGWRICLPSCPSILHQNLAQ